MNNRIHCVIDSLWLYSVVFVIMYVVLLLGAMLCIVSGNIMQLVMPTVADIMISYIIAQDLVNEYEKAKEEDLAE